MEALFAIVLLVTLGGLLKFFFAYRDFRKGK